MDVRIKDSGKDCGRRIEKLNKVYMEKYILLRKNKTNGGK